ncbi:protein kinase domain containing protein [Alphaentomopoxvirus acuprea]|uniref:Protein kinase domain containing protein n=1 Tax=Alphaentomopoxvirus acuprea TaxID=62099 RepID=W6JIS3_9POXV|nr:protein kinase domain containing protein [Anomala cuprea entomopoxvirus]BAO49447.1 protein kinase domain containing protein [Anomala cuprea entomopoxvirus]
MYSYMKLDYVIYNGHDSIIGSVKGINNNEYIAKIPYNKHSYTTELSLMRKLNHTNIIKFLNTSKCIIGDKYYDALIYEKEACSIKYMFNNKCYINGNVLIESIMNVITYLIKNNIIHRNIKFSNILCKSYEDFQHFKLTDFSYAIKYKNGENINLKHYYNKVILTAAECKCKLIKNNFITDKYHDVYSLALIIYKLLLSNYITITSLRDKEFDVFIDNYSYIIGNGRKI